MADFLNKVKATIARHGLLRRQGIVIVALSGGADSVALLSALCRLGYDCIAAHCNFHLRGSESVRDMRHADAIAARLGIDLCIKDFDVAARRAATGESIEMACRELRYKWFGELIDRNYGQAIAVGHHREDQIETFFLNLLRGSGLHGLSGMRYRNGLVVRPLLDVSRGEIEDYLYSEGLEWIVDSSNASDDFARNRLRNRLLPLLCDLFPGADDAILKSMEILRENSDAYTHLMSKAIAGYVDGDTGVNLNALAESKIAAPMLYEYLRGEGYNRTQTDDMLRAASNYGGAFAASPTHIRDVDHGMLRPPRAAADSGPDAIDISLMHDIFSPVNIQITHHNVLEFNPEYDSNIAYIDAAALSGNPRWQLRRWRRSDRMTPFGMKGSKLLSDIFASKHLSREEKANIWLLTRNDQILWIVGMRASADWAIGPSTQSYIRLQLQK